MSIGRVDVGSGRETRGILKGKERVRKVVQVSDTLVAPDLGMKTYWQ